MQKILKNLTQKATSKDLSAPKFFSFLDLSRVLTFKTFLGFYMRSLNIWRFFPSKLDPPVARSLSIQCILQELTLSFSLICELKFLAPKQLQGANIQEELDCISKQIEKILIFSLENPFAQKSSVLDKLCFYSEILLQSSKIDGKALLMILEEMRNSILKLKSQMIGWQKTPRLYFLGDMLEQVFILCKDLFEKLISFFNAFCPFLIEARSDENVLVYLLENQARLNACLGKRKVEEVLYRFFPHGKEQLRAAIHEGYMKRGFSDFYSKIEPLIDDFERQALCNQTQSDS